MALSTDKAPSLAWPSFKRNTRAACLLVFPYLSFSYSHCLVSTSGRLCPFVQHIPSIISTQHDQSQMAPRKGPSKHKAAVKSRQTYQSRKNIECSYCTEVFTCDFNRNQHVRATHTHEKPFVCPCGSSFTRKWLLNRHIIQVGHENYDPEVDGDQVTKRRAKRKGQAEAPPTQGSGHCASTMAWILDGITDFEIPTTNDMSSPHLPPGTGLPGLPSLPPNPCSPQSLPHHNAQFPLNLAGTGLYCYVCNREFETVVLGMQHGHEVHMDPYRKSCPCEICEFLKAPDVPELVYPEPGMTMEWTPDQVETEVADDFFPGVLDPQLAGLPSL